MTRHNPDQRLEDKTLEGIARSLATLASETALLASRREAGQLAPGPAVAASIRVHLCSRRARADVLEGSWFADPAWDLLLDLLASQHEGRLISISSACIAASVPPTTALRWLNRMLDAGIIYRIEDIGDRRRSFVGLASPVAARLEQWVARHLPILEGPCMGARRSNGQRAELPK
ncbi:MAG: hypothetical protein EON59_02705 [Alphaproteobacteria bacterium]|nr:MAG: hypothetical protein EON59_02705 [Alphaproteobacteria bacterium]